MKPSISDYIKRLIRFDKAMDTELEIIVFASLQFTSFLDFLTSLLNTKS